MTAIPDIPAPTFSCRVCGKRWKVYALDSDGDARALLGWRCPECTDLSRMESEPYTADDMESLLNNPYSGGGTVLTLAFGAVLGSLVLVGLLVLVAKTRGWL